MNIANDVRMTDSLERELMAQAIAQQQSYDVIADLKTLFTKVRAYFTASRTPAATAVHSTASQTA